MHDTTTLLHIAALYLDIYGKSRDLTRPLTHQQIKDAGVCFLDLLSAHEADLLITIEKARRSALPEPDYRDLVDQFIDRFEREEGITESLTEDQLYKA